MINDPATEVHSLAKGVRAVALAIVLILSCFNIRVALAIDSMRRIYADMYAGQPLPYLTEFIIHGRVILIILAILIPVIAILAVIRMRDHKYALYTIAGLILWTVLQLSATWMPLFLPLLGISVRVPA